MTAWTSWSGIADGLERADDGRRSQILRAWRAGPNEPAVALARRIFIDGSLEATIREQPRWRRVLEKLVWSPPAGRAAASLDTATVEAMAASGVVFVEGDMVVVPWEVVCAVASSLSELPPLAAAQLGRLGRSECVAIAQQLGVAHDGPTRAIIVALMNALTSQDGVAQVADRLPQDTITELMGVIDLGGRPVDPEFIGAPGLKRHLDRLRRCGLAFRDRGAYFIPVDVNSRLGEWRVRFISAEIDREIDALGRDAAPAAQAAPDEAPLPGGGEREEALADRLFATAVLDSWAARRNIALADPRCIGVWHALIGDVPFGVFHALREVAGFTIKRGRLELDALDLAPAAVVGVALEQVVRGLPALQAPTAALFGVQPYVQQLALLHGIGQSLSGSEPALRQLFDLVVGGQLEQTGLSGTMLTELSAATTSIVADWFGGFFTRLLDHLARLPAPRVYARADVTHLVWRTAQQLAAVRFDDLVRFGARFGGLVPLRACASLYDPRLQDEASRVAEILLATVLEPLGLVTSVGKERIALSPLLSEAVARLREQGPAGEPRRDDATVTGEVADGALVVRFGRGCGSARSVLAAMLAGECRRSDEGLECVIAPDALGGASEVWHCSERWQGLSAGARQWLDQRRPRVLWTNDVTYLTGATAAELDSFLAAHGVRALARPTDRCAIARTVPA